MRTGLQLGQGELRVPAAAELHGVLAAVNGHDDLTGWDPIAVAGIGADDPRPVQDSPMLAVAPAVPARVDGDAVKVPPLDPLATVKVVSVKVVSVNSLAP